uniref:15-cis-phytoene synthase n=1 Tax=Setaria viridis TaxID=4556 RepID=A0A4U6VX45_SETVI|nr:hypothetical protein SEVIR_2G314000v2 [Setaria viridis]
MMSTSSAVTSPACAAAWRRRRQQHDRWSASDAPGRAGTATFVAKAGRGRRVRGAAPCSVRAAGSDTIGCLEAEPWGAVAPARPPALALPGLQVAAPAPGDALAVPSEQRVHEVVLKQAALAAAAPRAARIGPEPMAGGLKAAFDRCGEVCKEYAKTFYLATQLMTPERRRAIWAIYVWCRRTDELVDGPNASHISALALDRWESRLEDIFAGRPYDMLDAALSDTVANFPVDIQPFRDMIEGMRMDLRKSRYRTFDELYLYCYYVAGTVGLMSVPVMGISPESRAATETVCKGALALGLANQLTNILRDVGEDVCHVPLTVRGGEGSTSHRTSWRWRGSRKPTSSTAASPTDGKASCGTRSRGRDRSSGRPRKVPPSSTRRADGRCGLLCFCTDRSWTRSRRTTTTTSPRGHTFPRRRS